MKKQILLILSLTLIMFTSKIYAQNIAINSTGSLPDTSAMLDVSSTIKGMLVPRMTTTQQNAIPLPATGLLVYNTTTNYFNVNIGTSSSPNWVPLAFTGSGITTLNGLTNSTQTFATGTSGSDFGITSSGSIHTLNLPDASATARGVITTGAQTIAGAKNFSGNTSVGGTLGVTGATTLGGAITASSVSSGARDLISKILVKDQSKRMKLQDVPRHPWILQFTAAQRGSATAVSASAK
jgi:hypothetical protein